MVYGTIMSIKINRKEFGRIINRCNNNEKEIQTQAKDKKRNCIPFCFLCCIVSRTFTDS